MKYFPCDEIFSPEYCLVRDCHLFITLAAHQIASAGVAVEILQLEVCEELLPEAGPPLSYDGEGDGHPLQLVLAVFPHVVAEQLLLQGAVQLVADQADQPALLVGVVVREDLVSDLVQVYQG